MEEAVLVVGIVVVAAEVSAGGLDLYDIELAVLAESNDVGDASARAFEGDFEGDGPASCVVIEPFPCGPFELVGEVGLVVAPEGHFGRFGFSARMFCGPMIAHTQ